MHVSEREAGDLNQLQRRVRREKDAEQRDRLRAVVLAIQGQPTQTIQDKLGRSRGFVQRWAYAYRDGGIDAIAASTPPGAASKLTPEQAQAFKRRMLAGPTDADGVCTLRGQDAVRILEREFGVAYSLPGVYDLLHRLNLACLRPRPRHRKNDPPAMQQWLDEAPFLSNASATHMKVSGSRSGSRTRRGSASRAR